MGRMKQFYEENYEDDDDRENEEELEEEEEEMENTLYKGKLDYVPLPITVNIKPVSSRQLNWLNKFGKLCAIVVHYAVNPACGRGFLWITNMNGEVIYVNMYLISTEDFDLEYELDAYVDELSKFILKVVSQPITEEDNEFDDDFILINPKKSSEVEL